MILRITYIRVFLLRLQIILSLTYPALLMMNTLILTIIYQDSKVGTHDLAFVRISLIVTMVIWVVWISVYLAVDNVDIQSTIICLAISCDCLNMLICNFGTKISLGTDKSLLREFILTTMKENLNRQIAEDQMKKRPKPSKCE